MHDKACGRAPPYSQAQLPATVNPNPSRFPPTSDINTMDNPLLIRDRTSLERSSRPPIRNRVLVAAVSVTGAKFYVFSSLHLISIDLGYHSLHRKALDFYLTPLEPVKSKLNWQMECMESDSVMRF